MINHTSVDAKSTLILDKKMVFPPALSISRYLTSWGFIVTTINGTE